MSRPGRVLLAVVLLVAVTVMTVNWMHGAREGGAPLVVLAMLAVGVVALDALARAVVRRLS